MNAHRKEEKDELSSYTHTLKISQVSTVTIQNASGVDCIEEVFLANWFFFILKTSQPIRQKLYTFCFLHTLHLYLHTLSAFFSPNQLTL